MHKIILYIISVLTVFTSCTTTDVPDKVSLQPQVMNDSLLTTMPGDLLLINDYLDRKSTRLNSSHSDRSRMPSSA